MQKVAAHKNSHSARAQCRRRGAHRAIFGRVVNVRVMEYGTGERACCVVDYKSSSNFIVGRRVGPTSTRASGEGITSAQALTLPMGEARCTGMAPYCRPSSRVRRECELRGPLHHPHHVSKSRTAPLSLCRPTQTPTTPTAGPTGRRPHHALTERRRRNMNASVYAHLHLDILCTCH